MFIRKSRFIIFFILISIAISGISVFSLDAEDNAQILANQLYNEGLYEQAIAKYREILISNPDAIQYRYMIANIYYLMKDNYKAIKELEILLNLQNISGEIKNNSEKLLEKCRWVIYSLPSNITTMTFNDTYLWVGTQGSGIFKFIRSNGSWFNYDIRSGLEDNYITALYSIGNELWIGTKCRGLSMFNDETYQWKYQLGPMEENIQYLLADKNYLWILTENGELFKFIKAEGKFEKLREFFLPVNLVQEENYLLVQTERELLNYEKEKNEWKSISPKGLGGSTTFSSIALDIGNIWLGTDKGELLQYEKLIGKDWKKFSIKGFEGKKIQKIESDGQILYLLVSNFATGGISSMDLIEVGIKSKTIKSFPFTEEEKEQIKLLLLDEKYIWIAVGNNLYGYYRK